MRLITISFELSYTEIQKIIPFLWKQSKYLHAIWRFFLKMLALNTSKSLKVPLILWHKRNTLISILLSGYQSFIRIRILFLKSLLNYDVHPFFLLIFIMLRFKLYLTKAETTWLDISRLSICTICKSLPPYFNYCSFIVNFGIW